VDGQATVTARGPAARIAAIRAALEAGLAGDPEPGGERTGEAREFDLLVELLTGGAEAGSWHAEVVVPFSVAQGGELELAEIPGLGPVLPATARELLAQADTVAQTAVDPSGQVIATSDPVRVDLQEPNSPEVEAAEVEPEPRPTLPLRPEVLVRLTRPPAPRVLTGSGYRFPPRLQRFLEARDRTCVFPGCGRPARRTDKDHRVPWPLGATTADNGQCLCRHHHRAKHTVFTVQRNPDGSYTWTTRGHWRFHRHPKGF
jgi:hypothetical protein